MSAEHEVVGQLRTFLEREPRVNLRRDRIGMQFGDSTMTLDGEVATIAAKRLTLELAAALPEVSGIVDRLHVAPKQAMGDGEIADHLSRSLLGDSSFDECAVSVRTRGRARTIRELSDGRHRGWVELEVLDGIVTLNGELPSLSHKRLAGVLAWWIPGSRDVVNGIAVEPVEADHVGEVIDAVRLVLEKDAFVDATQIRVACREHVVTLDGLVASEVEQQMAEFDAWAVFGVDDVINRIRVR
jgi:osmotically-inducible protein OsmY